MHLLILAFLLHVVKPGDTLWGMAGNHWPAVCQVNHIKNCDLIYPGQVVKIPRNYAMVESHIRPQGDGDNDADDRDTADPARPLKKVHHYNSIRGTVQGGTLSCRGLERLWEAAGGNTGSAFVAAEIAMAESGGRQYATGPAGERGYWQIHPDHGSLSTYNALGNARAAVIISGNGRSWGAWTTYTSGAYVGRCLHLRERRKRMTPGQIAYETYVESCGGFSVHGEPLPKWEDQQEHIRKHWEAAAKAVLEIYPF